MTQLVALFIGFIAMMSAGIYIVNHKDCHFGIKLMFLLLLITNVGMAMDFQHTSDEVAVAKQQPIPEKVLVPQPKL